MVSFIDAHRAVYGVEPICAQLPIAPSTYYEHKARETTHKRLPSRVRRDRTLSEQMQRVWDENFRVYGAEKVWKQLKRETNPRGMLHGGAVDASAHFLTNTLPRASTPYR